MIKVKQVNLGNKKIFEKSIFDDKNTLVCKKTIVYPLYKIEKDDYLYLILYNDEMQPVHDAFVFLNRFLISSNNSRFKAATALRLLYIFCDIYSYDIKKLNEAAILELKQFLIGSSFSNEFISSRHPKTINGYFAVYRNYFKRLGIKCDALFRTNANMTAEDMNYYSQSRSKMATRYDANMLTPDGPFSLEIPKYISPDEFRKIFNYLLKTKDVQSQIIVYLMYIYGLRIGEVLGLTLEDIRDDISNDNVRPIIYLRNRVSDKPFQYCKNIPHITDTRLYSSNSYIRSCTIIDLYNNWDLYRLMLSYIQKEHSKLKRKYRRNYETTKADTVTKNFEYENHYIFLNKYGKLLTAQTWGNHLKKIFASIGIPLDKNVKASSLSHRFRHGFAMFNAHFSPKKAKAIELQKMMRHKSISSTAIYYNPTNDDRIKIQSEFINEIFEQIPELKNVYEKNK